MGLTVLRTAWGGPKCGEKIACPAGEEYLPVSRRSLDDPPEKHRVGRSLLDWSGTLVGHYRVDPVGGPACFLDLPPSAKGIYTKLDPQADGEDGG